ncbi:hypothetical protein N7461_000004 [Penicillium sp. DV-2018c]|nr:hypothetical protein N7461_000004 [Penicillium sp. DV-2018c]
MRILSARLHRVESSTSVTTPNLSSIPAARSLHRILDAPRSPTYVGPTSAEFGLSRAQRSLSRELDYDAVAGDRAEDAGMSTIAPSPAASQGEDNSIAGDPLRSLGSDEALRLIQVYEDTVGVMYPCVDLDGLRTYVLEHYQSNDSITDSQNSDQDWFSARNVQVLKILLAIALLVETHGRSERAAQLADSVEDRFASRIKIAEVDMKEILILTLLSIFHSYRDDEVIAGRLIGMAVRGSTELGLHCQETWQRTGGVFPGELEWTWASRLFWCIYVLDRKCAFGTGLPFTIQDSDIDTNLPEPGHSTPYLTCMISHARLSAKIWGLVVGWPTRSQAVTADICAYLDAQVQQWIHSIPPELRFDPTWRSPAGPEHTDRAMMLQVLLALQANQLRILVYRQNLLSDERIADNIAGASIAVETAKSTVHMLDYFSRVSNIYFQRPEPFNYFLLSALAALFLAVLHAPARFSHSCRPEFYTAVDMVRRSATRARTSRRLQKIIRGLKRIRMNRWDNEPGRQASLPRTYPSNATSKNNGERSEPASNPSSQHKLYSPRGKWDSSTLPTASGSAAAQCSPGLHQPSTLQPPSDAFWQLSPGTVADPEPNYCEDLSSFFEMAGGVYFETQASTDMAAGVDVGSVPPGETRLPNAMDIFHAEDEALTRVMAGLL